MSDSLIQTNEGWYSPSCVDCFLDELGVGIEPVPVGEQFGWRPQQRQQDFLDICGFGRVLEGGPIEPPKATLIGYGGAAGGGKTDADLGLAGTAALAIPGIKIGLFRRTYPELEGADGAISRSLELYTTIPGARYNESKHRWTFANGSEIHFCHCQHYQDVFKYQSTQFGIIIFDESTHFTWGIVDYLITRNRTKAQWPGLGRAYPFVVCTTNPGGIGHTWYRQVFVDSGDADQVNQVETPSGAVEDVVFLPARLEDNPILRANDPDYERKLESRDEDTKRMLRYGDWDVAAGLYFGRYWRSVSREGLAPHVVPNRDIPRHWRLFGSVDYGFAAQTVEEMPFVYGLYATDELHVYRIDEVCGAWWDPQKQIAEIKELEARYPNHRVEYRTGCPGMFIPKENGAPSIAEQYAVGGVPVIHANTDRVNGWARCLQWLGMAADGLPHFMSFERCRLFNRQVPSLPADATRRDEIDRNAEDHAAEEWRHFLMSRPEPARPRAPKAPMNSSAGILEKARKNAA